VGLVVVQELLEANPPGGGSKTGRDMGTGLCFVNRGAEAPEGKRHWQVYPPGRGFSFPIQASHAARTEVRRGHSDRPVRGMAASFGKRAGRRIAAFRVGPCGKAGWVRPVAVEGARRPGYDGAVHRASELPLERQAAKNFIP
jgi:hypothetical protein